MTIDAIILRVLLIAVLAVPILLPAAIAAIGVWRWWFAAEKTEVCDDEADEIWIAERAEWPSLYSDRWS
jgi:hypothetical protein